MTSTSTTPRATSTTSRTSAAVPVDPEALRASVRSKYRDLALDPSASFHFHTGRPLAALLGYDRSLVDQLPDRAVAAVRWRREPVLDVSAR
jgi:arsenite methyltransferase